MSDGEISKIYTIQWVKKNQVILHDVKVKKPVTQSMMFWATNNLLDLTRKSPNDKIHLIFKINPNTSFPNKIPWLAGQLRQLFTAPQVHSIILVSSSRIMRFISMTLNRLLGIEITISPTLDDAYEHLEQRDKSLGKIDHHKNDNNGLLDYYENK